MKEIGNIYLSWRCGTGYGRHIVGIIKRNALEGVRFSYLKSGLETARKEGFFPYTEFPDLDKEYSTNVLDIFGQRIIKSERSDISDFFDFWEVNSKFKDDKYYLLAHTQGLNPTDNFEFLADYNPIIGLKFLTDLAGLSVLKLPPGSLRKGDELTYTLERANEFDSYAVRVFKGTQHVGYVKKIHNRVFYKNIGARFKLMVKAVDQNGFVKRVFVKISLQSSY